MPTEPTSARDFVHLHVHSDYSLLDGACKHEKLIEQAKAFGMGAVAVTDHGNLFGAMEFYQKAKKASVKPIIGAELYTVSGTGEQAHQEKGKSAGDYNHLLLLCKDERGYRNLSKLVSKGYLEGFYYKPRVSRALLRELSGGLICTSACLKGEVCQHLLADRYDLAKQTLEELRSVFAEGDLYIEVQRNGIPEQEKANRGLIELSKELSLPLVATCDCHYLRPEDKKAQDVLLCINMGKMLNDPSRLRMDGELHFRSKDEVAEAFRGLEGAIDATVDIAARCNAELETTKKYLPVYKPAPAAATATAAPAPGTAATGTGTAPPTAAPVTETADELFARLCDEGIRARYGARASAPEVVERLRMEVEVIRSMGFVSYFLITWDFIRWAREHGIPVGPGRGSAAGSIVAYALGITDVCPLKYDLLFERFLNKERISLPDIDIDFCQERRGEVIEYVRARYGKEAVAQIITFGTMAAKSVIRDVCRVLGISLQDADRLAKLIPGDLQVKRKKLKDALAESPELAQAIEDDPRFQEVLEIAEKLEGFARNASTHAAGVVIGDGPLLERVPLYRDSRHPEEQVTQYTMTLLEEACGLLKMDFLGLKTLTVIKWCLDLIERSEGHRPSVAMEDLPLDAQYATTEDPTARRTYELLQRGETKGVFQFESQGYRDLLIRLKPDQFEDIIALGAMYRPGPLGAGMVDAYVNRKHGREAVSHLHPLLETVLGETYGCMLYQEQVMRITNVLAGFSLNEADSLRKAMGKKRPEVMAKYKDKFVAGAGKNGCAAPIAEKVWEQMEFFAGYGFNKSHSTAYALVTFQTAWLKANYREEFMAALLTSEAGSIDKVVEYIDECARMGIEVLPPSVNRSDLAFTVVKEPARSGGRRGGAAAGAGAAGAGGAASAPASGKQIRYGLIAIRGVGEGPIREIVRARAARKRDFEGLYDLCAEVDPKLVNKAVLEALIKAGATTCKDGGPLAGSRAQQLALVEKALAAGQREALDRRVGQLSLFGGFGGAGGPAAKEAPPPALPDVKELTEKEILEHEKETLGFYLTAHPLNKHRERIRRYATATARTLAEARGEVVVGGVVTEVRARQDKKGNLMAFLTLEDLEGSFSAVCFSRTYAEVKDQLTVDAVVFVRGNVDTARGEPSVLIDAVTPMDKADEAFALEVRVRVQRGRVDDDTLSRLANAFLAHRGGCPVVLEIETRSGLAVDIRAARDLAVTPSAALERAVEEVLGAGACRFRGAFVNRPKIDPGRARGEVMPEAAEAGELVGAGA